MRAALALLLLLAARPALPCSAFLRDGPSGPLAGKGYDWDDERGLVLVNKRGVEKRALLLSAGQAPAAWRSRYASLTFNQYGRELPNGGMNEAGLVVEVLVLPQSAPEGPDARPALTELGLVQYLLDQAATAPEAIALARKVRVAPASERLHYFLCDAGGACAALELLKGELAVSAGEAMPVRALTNSPYAASVRALAHPPRKLAPSGSLARFARLAGLLRGRPAGDPVAAAFATLDAVRFEGSTRWQIVYDLAARRVHFRSRTHPRIKTVALGDFPPACSAPVMMLDMGSDRAGDAAADFVPYREATNRALVEATLRSMRSSLPAGAVERVADHPGTLVCAP